MGTVGNPRQKRCTKALAALAILGVAVGVLVLWLWGSEAILRLWFPHNRYPVLFETDLPLLRSACREVIEQRERFPVAINPREDGKVREGWYAPDVDDPALPEVLRSLHPSYIVVSENRLRAELYHCTRECAHFGVVIFPSGVVPAVPADLIDRDVYSSPPYDHLDQMAVCMVPGLWFYDTRLDDPGLQRRLQKFLQRRAVKKEKRDPVAGP